MLELRNILLTRCVNQGRVLQANSAFDYDGSTYANFNNDTFTPSFSDDGFTFSAQATNACSGLSDQFYRSCLFDVTVSGDANFARASAIAQSRIQELTASPETPVDSNEPSAEVSVSAALQMSLGAVFLIAAVNL